MSCSVPPASMVVELLSVIPVTGVELSEELFFLLNPAKETTDNSVIETMSDNAFLMNVLLFRFEIKLVISRPCGRLSINCYGCVIVMFSKVTVSAVVTAPGVA